MTRNAGTLISEPDTRTALALNRADSRPDAAPKKNIVTAIGSTIRPDSVTLAPKP